MPFRRENRGLTLPLIIIVLSIMLIGVGIQSWLAHVDDVHRDQATRADRAREHAYNDCLSKFSTDLVAALQDRSNAAVVVSDARDAKDKLLDELIVLSARASRYPQGADLPPALLRHYKLVIRQRVAAQHAYDRAVARYDRARSDNPLIAPQVVCTR